MKDVRVLTKYTISRIGKFNNDGSKWKKGSNQRIYLRAGGEVG